MNGTPIPASDAGMKYVAGLAAEKITQTTLPISGLGRGLPGAIPVILDHRNSTIRDVKQVIEAYRLTPERRSGKATATTLQSFIDLVNRHSDADSVLFATTTMPKPALLAVLDYHKVDGEPRWLRHRVEYAFPVTEEWKAWVASNGAVMRQGEFASFLEDHAAELSAPMDGERQIYEPLFKERIATPSELIALSRDLEIHVGAKIKRRERLKSGERTIEFETTHTGATGETIDIPGIFMIAVAAFDDGAPVRVPARLRYRPEGGDLVWLYQMWRPEKFLRERVKEDLRSAAFETSLPAFEGAPEL